MAEMFPAFSEGGIILKGFAQFLALISLNKDAFDEYDFFYDGELCGAAGGVSHDRGLDAG
jgi:hypothetical protein